MKKQQKKKVKEKRKQDIKENNLALEVTLFNFCQEHLTDLVIQNPCIDSAPLIEVL